MGSLRDMFRRGEDVMIREYRCEKCGAFFYTRNLVLSGRILCWQTADGQCARPTT